MSFSQKSFFVSFFFCIFTGYDMTKYTDNHTCANRQWKSTMKNHWIYQKSSNNNNVTDHLLNKILVIRRCNQKPG